ncbi:hypothetical protein HWV62_31355 [Athelia sp. TMB]|nr:hypothetical protein HWV62_31355 [Athelia sp. TMB]
MSIPSVQKVWKVVRQGTPKKSLVFDENAPVPTDLKPGDVLVKVMAAALNPAGYKIMKMVPNMGSGRPYAAENDFAGVVAAVSSDKSEFKVGDRVFGFVDLPEQKKLKQGALTQYMRMPESFLAHIPPGISFTEASGFALAGVTALQGLMQTGKLQPGQHVFVNGGSSAVGGFAIQILKAKGCHVVASASARNQDYVLGLGADEFFDYTAAPLHKTLAKRAFSPKFDIIFDAVGLSESSLYVRSRAYLAPGGIYVSTIPEPVFTPRGIWNILGLGAQAYLRPRWLGGVPSAFKCFVCVHNKEDLYAIRDLIQEGSLIGAPTGKLRPTTDSIYAFEDALQAYDKLMTKRTRGKVVVRVDPDAE